MKYRKYFLIGTDIFVDLQHVSFPLTHFLSFSWIRAEKDRALCLLKMVYGKPPLTVCIICISLEILGFSWFRNLVSIWINLLYKQCTYHYQTYIIILTRVKTRPTCKFLQDIFGMNESLAWNMLRVHLDTLDIRLYYIDQPLDARTD